MTDGATRAVLRAAPGPLKPGLDADASAKNGGYMRRSWVLAAPIAALVLVIVLASCPNPAVDDDDGTPETFSYKISVGDTGPTDGGVTVLDQPTVTWNPVTGAVAYQLRWSVGSAGLAAATAVDTGTSTSYTLPPVDDDSNVYWQVRAQNAAGVWGVWDDAFSFWRETVPTRFSSDPPDASMSWVPGDGTVSWGEIDGVEAYVFEIAPYNDFNPADTGYQLSGELLANEFAPSLLTPGSQRYWRIRIKTAGVLGPWLSARQFWIRWDYTVTPLAPADELITFDRTPTFSWSAIDGAPGALVEVSTDDLFTSHTDGNATGTSYTPSTTSPLCDFGQTRYWRVTPKNAEGFLGSTEGPVRSVSFSDANTIAQTTTNRPDFNAEQTVSWTPLVGAVKYDLDYSIIEGADPDLNPDAPNLGANNYNFGPVPRGSPRRWVVRAYNDTAGSPDVTLWSEVFEIRVAWDYAATPTNDGASRPTFTWTATADGTGNPIWYQYAYGVDAAELAVRKESPTFTAAADTPSFLSPITQLENQTCYYSWRAMNTEGIFGDWCDFQYTYTK